MGLVASAAKYRRVAAGIYERNGSYYVPVRERGADGVERKVWHGPPGTKACLERGCRHTQIQDFASAKTAKREIELARESSSKASKTRSVEDWFARRVDGGEWLQLFPRVQEDTNVHNEERVGSFLRWMVKRHGPGYPLLAVSEEDAAGYAVEHPSSVREVRAAFNDAVKIRAVPRNPFAQIKVNRSGRGRKDITILSLQELELLGQVAREEWGDYGPQMAAMIEIAAWTGLRPSELYLLSMNPSTEKEPSNWVDLAHRRIHVDWAFKKAGKIGRPKYESIRKVIILPPAERAFRQLERSASPTGKIFVTQRGSAFTPRNQNYYWDRVRRAFRNQLPEGHWLRKRVEADPKDELDLYELRHFFGSSLAQPPWHGIRPASGLEIADQMGHKDKGATAMEYYIHPNAERVATDLLDAWTQPGEVASVAEFGGRA
jgi:integrase